MNGTILVEVNGVPFRSVLEAFRVLYPESTMWQRTKVRKALHADGRVQWGGRTWVRVDLSAAQQALAAMPVVGVAE